MGVELVADQTLTTPLMHIWLPADEQQVFKACEQKAQNNTKKKHNH